MTPTRREADEPAIPHPVDLGPARLPVAGGVTALVVSLVHLLLAILVLIAGIVEGEREPLTVGAIYTAVSAALCGLGGLTLRGRRWAAITLGVCYALGATLFALALLGFAGSERDQDPVVIAIVAGLLVACLVPSILCFRDARRLRLTRLATIDNLRAAFQ